MKPTDAEVGATSPSSATDRTLARLRLELESHGPSPSHDHLDYLLIPYTLATQIRWLLTSSSSLPQERVAAIDALDIAIADHRAHCAKHQEP